MQTRLLGGGYDLFKTHHAGIFVFIDNIYSPKYAYQYNDYQ